MRRYGFWACLVALGMAVTCHAEEQGETCLTVPILFEGAIPEDMEEIRDAVDELVMEKIGVNIDLVAILYNTSSSDLDQRQKSELTLLEKQGITFDVYPTVLSKDGFLELDELLEEEGKEIQELIGEKRMELLREDGVIRTLPSVSDYVSSFGITMRADLAEKAEIDPAEIVSVGDLDAVFQKIQQQEPEMSIVCSYRTRRGFIDRLKGAKILVEPICAKDEKSGQLVNYYTTEEYKEMVTLFYEWNEKGYLPEALPLQNLMGSSIVESGTLFSYFSPCKPSIEYEESMSCGMEMITIPLMEPMVTDYSLKSTVHWGISETCSNPKEAMQFLNLLYTDSELVNMMIYGIEGIHYEVQEDGTIAYPEGVTRESEGYQNTQPWLLPNQLISYVWSGNDPLLWEKTHSFNERAKWQEGLFFSLQSDTIEEEIEKLEEIIDTYAYGLESGQLDPEIYLPRMLREMEEAGAERVVEEAQRQWNADF